MTNDDPHNLNIYKEKLGEYGSNTSHQIVVEFVTGMEIADMFHTNLNVRIKENLYAITTLDSI